MKKFLLIVVLFLAGAVLFSADNTDYQDLAEPTDLVDQFSYTYGYLLLKTVLQVYPNVSLEYLAKGIYDSSEDNSFYTESEMQSIYSDYQFRLIQENAEAQRKLAADNLKKANDFLLINRKNSGVQETNSGVQFQVLREGTGEKPAAGSNVRVDYQGYYMTGTVFDSSYERKIPSDLNLNNIIPGLSEGIQLMTVGSKYRFWIPPELGYGESSSKAEPNSLLIFEVELLAINK